MDHWTENYCEEENNLLAYNRFMLDRLQQQQRQEGQRTHANLACDYLMSFFLRSHSESLFLSLFVFRFP